MIRVQYAQVQLRDWDDFNVITGKSLNMTRYNVTFCNMIELTLVLGLQECRLHFLMQYVKKCNYNQIKIKSTIFKMIVEFFEPKVFFGIKLKF